MLERICDKCLRIMEKLSESEVTHLSEYIAKNDLEDTILMMKGTYDAESVVEFIESWCRVGGYPYRHHVADNVAIGAKKHGFSIQHDMGERWSLYLVELFKFAFEKAGTKLDFQHTPNTISFSVEI